MTDWLTLALDQAARDRTPRPRETDPDPSACVICGAAPRAVLADGTDDETCGAHACREEWIGQLWGRY